MPSIAKKLSLQNVPSAWLTRKLFGRWREKHAGSPRVIRPLTVFHEKPSGISVHLQHHGMVVGGRGWFTASSRYNKSALAEFVTYKKMLTLLCEGESVFKGRPLAYLSDGPNEMTAIALAPNLVTEVSQLVAQPSRGEERTEKEEESQQDDGAREHVRMRALGEDKNKMALAT
ncbi:hypothetical protein TNCV_4975971 [Trichonephila clavipes]|uniref:Uncharacterized protein n=1 Tax=Trichonephila clavipes TaxID=2585209 RepID=A0A8X6VBF4_TRICX|nr:hypothetical protein TNCV_4975971 [Trichonephila clavipes]